MYRLSRWAINHPKPTILIALIVTAVAGAGIARLKLRTDGQALVPRESPAIHRDAEIRQAFGFEDPMVVLIRAKHEAGIYNTATVQLVRELTSAFIQMQGITAENVVSLATVQGFRHRQGTIKFQTLLEPPLTDEAEFDQLRDDLRRIVLYQGTIVAEDEQSTAVFVGVPKDRDRAELYNDVQKLIASFDHGTNDVAVIGAPAAETLLGLHILADLGIPDVLLDTSIPETERQAWENQNVWRIPSFLRQIGLAPLAIVILAIVFLIAFRSFTAVLLPLAEAGACLIFVFGIMGWTDTPIYLTTAVMPVILVAMGVTDEIHIFKRYLSMAQGETHTLQAVRLTMKEMWRPVVKTSVTTAIGFLSFSLSPLAPVQSFGAFTALGMVFCMFFSLTVIPALLASISPSRFVKPKIGGPFLHKLAAIITHRPKTIIGVFVLCLATLPLGLRHVQVGDSWIDGYDPDSGFRRATEYFDAHFYGANILLIHLDAGYENLEGSIAVTDMNDHEFILPKGIYGEDQLLHSWINIRFPPSPEGDDAQQPPNRTRQWRSYIANVKKQDNRWVVTCPRTDGSPLFWMRPQEDEELDFTITNQPFMKPGVIEEVAALASFLESKKSDGVGGILSPHHYLETTAFMLKPDAPEPPEPPQSPKRVRELWSKYRFIRGEEILRQLVDQDFGSSLMAIFLRSANFQDTAQLMEALRKYEHDHLKEKGIVLDFGGNIAVSQTLVDSIVTSQVKSLLFSLIGILFVSTLMSRSWARGLLTVLPSFLAVLVSFAIMGFLRIPVGVATSMFAAMTLGLGVDFAIHLLESYRMSRDKKLDVTTAIRTAIEATTPPNFINALALGVGFGILTLSRVPINAKLGILVFIGVALCALTTILLIPATLRLMARK